MSPSTLKQADKAKLLRWATEHHMPSEPGVAFERWLDALQGVDEDAKAKALALSRASGPVAPHDFGAAEARFGVLGLFVFAAAAILAAAKGVVDVVGEVVQQIDPVDAMLNSLVDTHEKSVAATVDVIQDDVKDGASATRKDLLDNLLAEFNVKQLSREEINELDTITSERIKTLIQNVTSSFTDIFTGVSQADVVNTFNHMSPILEQFFSEAISQVALKHNIGFLQELQTELNSSKKLTIPNSYNKMSTALKPVITKSFEDLGALEKNAVKFADVIFMNVERKFKNEESLNRWLVKDVTPANMRVQLIKLTRLHIMTGNEPSKENLYTKIILDTVLGSQELFVENEKQNILNEIAVQPENPMYKAIITTYTKTLKKYTKEDKEMRINMFGRLSDEEKVVSDVLDIARVLSPAILSKYQNDTLGLARDLVERVKIISQKTGWHIPKPSAEQVDRWIYWVVGAVFLYWSLPKIAGKILNDFPKMVKEISNCRTSGGSGGESKTHERRPHRPSVGKKLEIIEEAIVYQITKKSFTKPEDGKWIKDKNKYVKLKQRGVPDNKWAQSQRTLLLDSVEIAKPIGVIRDFIYEADE